MADVLDPAQLIRIQATHRGFLYQHLYAVASILAAPVNKVLRVRVERDQDIELDFAAETLYVQVKTREGHDLMPSEISGALADFAPIRAAHAAGTRMGAARFAVVSNALAGPKLAEEVIGWSKDTVFVAGPTPPAGLVEAPPTIADLLALCCKLAEHFPLSSLRPETLVWKLAALVAAAAAGQGGVKEFDVEMLPALCEMVVAELHPLPRVERYRPQQGEPEPTSLSRVSIVVGHTGTGKSAWAGQVGAHQAEHVVYFRCSDVPDEQIAPRLVREAVAVLAKRSSIGASTLVLPGATGLEALAMLDSSLRSRQVSLIAIVDDCHRVAADTLIRAVEGTAVIRWILLAQRNASVASVAARLQVEPLELGGWNDDTVADVLAEAKCSAEPRGVSALRKMTAGAPLLVKSAAAAVARRDASNVMAYVESVRNGALSSKSPQELLLADAVASLSPVAMRIAAGLACVDFSFSAEIWSTALTTALGVDPRICAASLRDLVAGGFVIETELDELAVHDAFRPLFDMGALSSVERRAVQSAIATHLADDLLGSRSAPRLIAYCRVLRDLGNLRAVSELATSLAEWIRELGESRTVYALVDRALATDHDLSIADRFWAEDSLAFFDLELGDLESAAARTSRAEQLLQDGSLGANEQGAVLNKKLMLRMTAGDIAGVRELMPLVNAMAPKHARYLQYNAACAELRCGNPRAALAALDQLADDYLTLCGLTRASIFGMNPEELSRRLEGRGIDTDDIRHAADCFDALAKATHRVHGPRGLGGLFSIWAFKFFELARAWSSLVKTGQDVADHLVGLGDLSQARTFLKTELLPRAISLGLVERSIAVRSQHAVVCALCGDFREAEAEMNALSPYLADLGDELRREVENQRGKIAQLRKRAAFTPVAAPRASVAAMGPPSQNGACPCGSGKKFKRCCGLARKTRLR